MARGETDDTQDFNAATEAGGTAATAETPGSARVPPAPVLRKASPDPVTDPRLTETEASEFDFDDDEDEDEADEPAAAPAPLVAAEPVAAVASHRRGPGLWLVLLLFVVLLVAGAAVGRFVVPATVPQPGAVPPGPTNAPTKADTEPPTTTTTGPALPTPPERPADALAGWARQLNPVVDIPLVALQAYGYAQLTAQSVSPGCHLAWTTLAGIGEVESHHGQAGGAVLGPNGRSVPPIEGPALDGKGGRALVADTDAGAFDADTTFDHAMGPLGILPSAWRTFGIDADGDGILDPYDIDDAALAMAGLLCSGGDDMSQRAGWNKAVAHQHSGTTYGQSVFNAADSYGQRTRNIG